MAIVGGGAVGLAAAAALAGRGRAVVLLERHAGFGRETTSRNSEVIHAGLYYPPGSHKARFCVEGRERLYRRCETHGIPHRRLGKLVVASREGEHAVLESLCAQGRENGAGALELIDAAALSAREPAVRALAALWSPESGIVDAHGLCSSLAAEAESAGALLALRHEFLRVEASGGGGCVLAVRDPDGEVLTLRASRALNAAGLGADALAEETGVDLDAGGFRHHWCKGDYFALAPGSPISLHHLVYPVPAGAGLGIHATLDLGGGIRFGPDTEYVDAIDYRIDARKAAAFAEAVRRYLPGIRAADLHADYAGIRPKRAAPGEGFRDFALVPGGVGGEWLHLIGIESPGLTAALALGEYVAAHFAV